MKHCSKRTYIAMKRTSLLKHLVEGSINIILKKYRSDQTLAELLVHSAT